jgi:hypothetical protein
LNLVLIGTVEDKFSKQGVIEIWFWLSEACLRMSLLHTQSLRLIKKRGPEILSFPRQLTQLFEMANFEFHGKEDLQSLGKIKLLSSKRGQRV